MKYSALLEIRSSASRWRLRALIGELSSLDCQTRLDREGGSVELDVPDDLYCWLRAGGLGNLLQSYNDVIARYPTFHEVADEPEVPKQLPAPGNQGGRV
jgi:hypothetical protein